jgi:hypothetical protein
MSDVYERRDSGRRVTALSVVEGVVHYTFRDNLGKTRWRNITKKNFDLKYKKVES